MKDLVQVFTDTFNKSYDLEKGATKLHNLEEIGGPYLSVYDGNIKVINTDTVSALIEYSKLGKTGVLNMASYKRPGGGVERGARAQEECLFRCSNLSHSISTDFYPLSDDVCLYTQDAIFFKDKDYDYMSNILSDVITIAAINLNGSNHQPTTYRNLTLQKIRLMLSIPAKHGVENLILGAWGCGVFGNDPQIMSNFFEQVLIGEGYASLYKNVVFAIINDHNSVGNNFNIFSNNLK